MGSPPTFARNLLIPRLPEFYRLWPDIEIEIDVVPLSAPAGSCYLFDADGRAFPRHAAHGPGR